MATLQGNQGQAGKQFGQNLTVGFGEFNDLLVTELQARFYQQAIRANVYSAGMQITSISAVTFSSADGLGTLTNAALSTPIVGIWNPSNSGVNAVVLQANVPMTFTSLTTAIGPGPLVWAGFSGQTANITTATKTAVNRKTFASPGGAQCQNVSGLALTGLQNIGSYLGASAIPAPSTLDISNTMTASGFYPSTAPAVENVDGSIIVQPGGILALYASVTPAALSAASSLLWYEVPTTV